MADNILELGFALMEFMYYLYEERSPRVLPAPIVARLSWATHFSVWLFAIGMTSRSAVRFVLLSVCLSFGAFAISLRVADLRFAHASFLAISTVAFFGLFKSPLRKAMIALNTFWTTLLLLEGSVPEALCVALTLPLVLG